MVYKRISSERMEEFIKNNGVGFTASTPEEEETEDSMETGETITSYSSYNQVHFSPETTKGLTGDVNGDGTVDLSDAVLIMQSLANPTKYGLNGSDDKHITEEWYLRADVDGEGVTNMDALTIQRYLLGLCSIEL